MHCDIIIIIVGDVLHIVLYRELPCDSHPSQNPLST